MPRMPFRLSGPSFWGILLLAAGGCATLSHDEPSVPPVPHELARVSLPPYVIESPDILTINALRLIPRPPYRVEPLDTLGVRVTDTLPEQPIQGVYGVEPDGRINLGYNYGSVSVSGMTIEEAEVAVKAHLRKSLKPGYQVNVVLSDSRGLQLIRGSHIVQTDGVVNLGLYGSVYVDNMTIPQAKEAIEGHLAQFLVKPEISLTVSGYNSKVFYLVSDGGGVAGEQISRLPMVGKTTVLDALGQVGGLPYHAATCKMWLVRPAPVASCETLVLPVDYKGIVRRGETDTNYQIMPGDRLYVKAAPLLTADAYLARVLAPIDRLLGTSLLTSGAITGFQNVSTFHSTRSATLTNSSGQSVTGTGLAP
jgi:polysaccharide export outer membrane protein